MTVAGDALVRVNGPVVSGFHFNRSQMDKQSFTLHAFAQMLTIPREGVTLGVSLELGDYSTEAGDEAAFAEATREADGRGRAYLDRVGTCDALLQSLPSTRGAMVDDTVLREIRSHCLLLRGDYDAARRELEALVDDASPQRSERASIVLDALEQSPESAMDVLTGWQSVTCAALGLPSARNGGETPN
jgi:hypothetical protein